MQRDLKHPSPISERVIFEPSSSVSGLKRKLTEIHPLGHPKVEPSSELKRMCLERNVTRVARVGGDMYNPDGSKVTLVVHGGETTNVMMCHPDSTVYEVVIRLKLHPGVPLIDVRLSHAGKQLDHMSTLRSCNLSGVVHIQLSLCLRGGSGGHKQGARRDKMIYSGSARRGGNDYGPKADVRLGESPNQEQGRVLQTSRRDSNPLSVALKLAVNRPSPLGPERLKSPESDWNMSVRGNVVTLSSSDTDIDAGYGDFPRIRREVRSNSPDLSSIVRASGRVSASYAALGEEEETDLIPDFEYCDVYAGNRDHGDDSSSSDSSSSGGMPSLMSGSTPSNRSLVSRLLGSQPSERSAPRLSCGSSDSSITELSVPVPPVRGVRALPIPAAPNIAGRVAVPPLGNAPLPGPVPMDRAENPLAQRRRRHLRDDLSLGSSSSSGGENSSLGSGQAPRVVVPQERPDENEKEPKPNTYGFADGRGILFSGMVANQLLDAAVAPALAVRAGETLGRYNLGKNAVDASLANRQHIRDIGSTTNEISHHKTAGELLLERDHKQLLLGIEDASRRDAANCALESQEARNILDIDLVLPMAHAKAQGSLVAWEAQREINRNLAADRVHSKQLETIADYNTKVQLEVESLRPQMRQLREDLAAEKLKLELRLAVRPDIIALNDDKVREKARFMSENRRDLEAIALAEYQINEYRENGRAPNTSTFKRDIRFVHAPPNMFPELGRDGETRKIRYFCKLNQEMLENPDEVARQKYLDVAFTELVPVHYFVRKQVRGWLKYFASGLLTWWKATVKDYHDADHNARARWIDPIMAKQPYKDTSGQFDHLDPGFFQDQSLARSTDRRMLVSVLQSYKMFGLFESAFMMRLLGDSDNFIAKGGFTHIRYAHVHPGLYQAAWHKFMGANITDVYVNAVLRELKKDWFGKIPPDLIIETVRCAAQHVASVKHDTSMTLAAGATGIPTA